MGLLLEDFVPTLGNGSASAPAIRIGAANTGLFNDGGELKLTEAGTPRSIPSGGKIVQLVTAETGTAFSTTSVMTINGTPQSTEGVEVLTCQITPVSAASSLVAVAMVSLAAQFDGGPIGALFRDSDADALVAGSGYIPPVSNNKNVAVATLVAVVSSGSTNPTNFKLRVGASSSGTVYCNRSHFYSDHFGAAAKTSIVLWEVSP